MKTKKVKKLVLKKETITKLNRDSISAIQGGMYLASIKPTTCITDITCEYTCPNCPPPQTEIVTCRPCVTYGC